MMVCEDCGGDEDPFSAVIRTGRHRGYLAVFTACFSCQDPTTAQNADLYNRDEEELEEAVEVMESHDVVCYLNGKTLDEVKDDLDL
ncbi:hypothetical protein DWB78_18595 [Halopelagius longus]|uniref:Uncharacterized protein n=2 Tax=Halopelagius longus TaxID=1236180 RepID=A0A370IJ92_9EURY|nr:hypothetical protein DWB78_18595 [Halopelagius longus]